MKQNERVFFSLDFEVGDEADKGGIIEFGLAVIKDLKIVESCGSLIKPYKPYNLKFLEYSNIDEKELKNAKFTIDDFVQLIIGLAKKYSGKTKYDKPMLVGHNIHSFDMQYLNICFNEAGIYLGDYFGFLIHDTLELTDVIFYGDNKLANKKLKTICDYLNIQIDRAHRAEDDAIACAKIFIKYVTFFSQNLEKSKLLKI